MNARRSLAIAMLVVPLIITATAVVVMLAAGGDLTGEVVLNWGLDGPNAWGPAWVYPLGAGLLGVVLPIVMWATMGRTGRVSGTAVFLAGFMIWLTSFLGMSMGAALIVPDDAGWWSLAAAATGLVLAVPAWLWLPRQPRDASSLPELPTVEPRPGEVLAWHRTVLARPAFYWAIALLIVGSLVIGVVATAGTDGRAAVAFVAPVVLTVLLVLTAGWRVSVGPAGLTVRGLVGLPVFRVPLEDMVEVSAVRGDPVADFGGWGIRWVPAVGGASRTGIVIRAGEGLQVTRRDGREFVVTVDDAPMAAAVLRAHLPARGTARSA